LKKAEEKSTVNPTPKKRGAPKGHRGATRPTPVPDKIEEVIADHCEKCGSPNLKVLDSVEKTVIEGMLPPQEIKIIQYDRKKVECLQCGHIFTSKDPDCPQKGNFGIYLLVYITMLKFHLRGVLRKFLDEEHTMEERVSQKAIFEKKLEDIVDKFDGFDELKKPLTYIKNGLWCWYTCMLYPGMEPTNNLGEQAIREHVILRKIIGCFRSENGAENYQHIASLLADWRLQGKNGFEELEQLLRQELCMSKTNTYIVQCSKSNPFHLISLRMYLDRLDFIWCISFPSNTDNLMNYYVVNVEQ